MKMNKEIVMVRLTDIIPNRFQPRLTFDEEALNELAASIKEHGIIQPLILRDLGNKYEIIAGERRYKASQIAGVLEVPAVIGQMDDQTSAELALIENIQRKDLSAIEEAKSYKKLLDMGDFTQEELAKKMGKGQSTIANKMRLLSLTNEVQVALMNNLISERHARCLLQVKDEEKQKEVLNKIITERMNVRDTDNYIKNILGLKDEDVPIEKPIAQPLDNNDSSLNDGKGSDIDFSIDKEKVIEIKNDVKDNPNVYTQTDNIDFIDLNNLTSDEAEVNEVKAEDNEKESIEKEDDRVQNIDLVVNNNQDVIDKIKLATAIRIAKDAIDDIRLVGYNASIRENDNGNSYQIVIDIEK